MGMDLNSVLIEGTVQGDPRPITGKVDDQRCHFTVSSKRFYKENDEYHEEVALFEVLTVKHPSEIKEGTRVRVVGRLAQEAEKHTAACPPLATTTYKPSSERHVYIAAEHIECLPERKPVEKPGQVPGADVVHVDPA